jgi:hypothetical protein
VAVDNPVPLCTVPELQQGAFADLVKSFPPDALEQIVVEATRACETETHRRLAPFTLTESHRAGGIDPDEYDAVMGGIPLDQTASLSQSYAASLGNAGSMVRHVWLNEYAPMFPEMWEYGPDITVQVTRSIGGTQSVRVLSGPEPDSGHVWFAIGEFIPLASMLRVTYSGGYSTVPADLRRACKYMAAAICVRELDPIHGPETAHDAGNLEELAGAWLLPYGRSA